MIISFSFSFSFDLLIISLLLFIFGFEFDRITNSFVLMINFFLGSILGIF